MEKTLSCDVTTVMGVSKGVPGGGRGVLGMKPLSSVRTPPDSAANHRGEGDVTEHVVGHVSP